MTNLFTLHTPFSEQMKNMETWLRELIEKTSRDTALHQQLEIIMGLWFEKKQEIEDAYNALLGSKATITTSKYVKNGNNDVMELTIEELQQYDPLTFFSLSLYLPSTTNPNEVDLYGTFNLYWNSIKNKQKRYHRWSCLNNHMNLRWHPKTPKPSAGFKWEAISMNTLRNEEPRHVRNNQQHANHLPHLGVFATAQQHSNWTNTMNGREVPYVFIPGFDVRNIDDLWSQVLFLKFEKNLLILSADYHNEAHQGWSNPLLRGCKHICL